jgi:hypothetical protein
MDHEVLDCPRMIPRLEKLNIEKARDQETQIIEEPQKKSQKVLMKMQETLNDHRDLSLLEIFKKKEQIEVRIGDFDIDCVLDEETPVNIMTEETWKAIGRPDMTPSLGGIGLFKGKLVNLCGKLTYISMNAHGASTEEDFEIVKFVEDSALFTMLLGKPWIEKDQARKQEAEKDLEQQRQKLRDFMTRRIVQLIEERENRSRVLDPRNLDDEVDKMLEEPQRTKKYVGQVIPVDMKKES